MITNEILLIQPRHIYAPDFEESIFGHIYFPTSLISIASILLHLNIKVKIIDENIQKIENLHNIVGINLLGAPYIPVVKKFEAMLSEKFNENYKLFIGGSIVNGLNKTDFKNLFSCNVINGNDENEILNFFQIKSKYPKLTELSHIPVFEILPDGYLEKYLKNEIGFYLSQGCKYSCSFCSATRTKEIKSNWHRETEIYRDIAVSLKDLKYLIIKAKEFGYTELDIYLSNLDLFQTPEKLSEFALGAIELKKEFNFQLNFRGLSTVASFLETHKTNPNLIVTIKEAGLVRVGFGIDGATPEVYKQTRKPQKIQMCLDAIRISREVYSITPETLMVFGHNDKEDESSLKQAVDFCKDMLDKYQALPRPHIAKDIVPGNDGWNNPKNSNIKLMFYNNISLFQNLDFTALPSAITHRDNQFREIVTKYYTEICSLPNALTQYVLPENENLKIEEIYAIKEFNKGRYDL